MPHATRKIAVTPLASDGKKTNFGAVVTGVDLNELDDESFQQVRQAVYEHSVIVIKDQQKLLPAKQFEFVHRFDPDARPQHGFGYGKTKKDLGELGKNPYYVIPDSGGGVTLVGSGFQGETHFGLANVTMHAFGHVNFHARPLTDEQRAANHTRINTFHFDGILHNAFPSRVTTFRCVRAPCGPDLTVHLSEDLEDSQRSFTCAPGSTAFLSSTQLYDLLTDEEKQIVDNSEWEPAPHPFAWRGTRKMRAAGLGLEPGGETVPLEQLSPWTEDQLRRYPLVWLNPVTGAKGLQAMPDTVRRLYVRKGPDEPERVVEDLEEIRVFFNKLYDRILVPEYILAPKVVEGDVVVWNNWGVLHSGIGYPTIYGSRSMHQCHIASSTSPSGPRSLQ